MIEMHHVGATFTVAHRPNETDSLGDRKGRPYACRNSIRVLRPPPFGCIAYLKNNILENTR